MREFPAKVKLALASKLQKIEQYGVDIQNLKQELSKKVNKATLDSHKHSFTAVKTGYMTKAVFDNCIGCLLHVTAPHNVGKTGKK